MEAIELTGKSLEEARAAAAQKLGVSEDGLTVTVLEQTKGLFGKSNVRIRAEVKAGAAAEEKPKRGRAKKPEAVAEAVVEIVEAAPPAEEPVAEAPAPRRGRAKKPEPAIAETAAEPEGAAAPEIVATDEDAKAIRALVQGVLDAGDLGVDAQVKQIQGRYVYVELDGKDNDVGYLVGKSGEVLNAMQYLFNIMATQKLKTGVRLTLDAKDYRQRRESALNKYAEQIANEVLNRKEEAVLDPLPAFERRIIHKALAEVSGVTTYSEGEEPNRRVVIAPSD